MPPKAKKGKGKKKKKDGECDVSKVLQKLGNVTINSNNNEQILINF